MSRVEYLQVDDIILINEMTVAKHGGNFVPPDNLLHHESLSYLVEAAKAEMYGEPLYPTVADKAALYFFSIISNHVFQDGNKRTGLEAALLFLRLNSSQLQLESELPTDVTGAVTSSPLLYNFTLSVAAGQHDLASVRDWFAARVEHLQH